MNCSNDVVEAKFRWRSTLGAFGACTIGALAVVFSGCMTIEEMAPTVGPEFAQRDVSNGSSLIVLQEGRKVYLSNCSRCHSIEPISRYSRDRWRSIVVRMAPESRLDAASTEALEAYVLAAHNVLERRSASN